MALLQKQQEDRSELQKRIGTELQEKLRKRAELEPNAPDGVADSVYMENKKESTPLMWLWLTLLAGFILFSLWIIIS